MTLQQLEYIVAIADHQQFQKAADACDVTQPTLSSMVQKLEEELGVKIFDRRQKPIVPTAVGNVILEQARLMLAQARRLRESVDEEQHAMSGTFRIAVLPTIAPYLIPRFFPNIAKRFPQLDLRIKEMRTADIRRALAKGEIDAAILARADHLEEFSIETLFFEQYFVYVSPDNQLNELSSIRTSDLKDASLWLLDEGHCFRDQLVKFCQLKGASHSQKAYKLGSIETFMRIVEQGVGATFIPELCTLQLTAEQRKLIRPFAVPVPTREVIMMTASDFVRHTLLDALNATIRDSVPASMLRLSVAQKHIGG